MSNFVTSDLERVSSAGVDLSGIKVHNPVLHAGALMSIKPFSHWFLSTSSTAEF